MKQFQFVAHLKDFNSIIRKRKLNVINRRKEHGFLNDLNNPLTLQDKIHWLIVYDNKEKLKALGADKYRVREYVIEKLKKDICIPLVDVYDNINQIDWEKLPNKFVIKCNHGSHMNFIVKDKTKVNKNTILSKIDKWLKIDFGSGKFADSKGDNIEYHYSLIKPKIVIEKYMNDGHDDLIDYKFLCFNGQPKYCQIISDRHNSKKRLNYYDMDFNFVNISRTDFKANSKMIDSKPENFELMKKYAEILSSEFKFVRVDFYEINGEVYLGELTFTPAIGFCHYTNRGDEIKLGNLLDLN